MTTDPSGDVSAAKVRRANGKPAIASPLGAHLRRERGRLGVSLRELARRLDVSPSLVSQIETDKIQPSVGTLYAMVRELGISFDEVFAPPPETGGSPARARTERRAQGAIDEQASGTNSFVQRAHDRRVLELESGVRWERLKAWNDPDVEFLHATYEIGGASSANGTLVRHNGREFGTVIDGRLGVTVGFEEYVLEPGDSISFESSIPHRLHNDGNEAVTAIWVVLGRYQDDRQ